MAIEQGRYGPVLILAGAHAGKVGYYDDEAAEGDSERSHAVVYLGEPFVSEYVLVPHADVRPLAATNLELERWKRAHPWLSKYLGVP